MNGCAKKERSKMLPVSFTIIAIIKGKKVNHNDYDDDCSCSTTLLSLTGW